MSDKQIMALLRYVTQYDVTEVRYGLEDQGSWLEIAFYDAGRNFHRVGIRVDGTVKTYES